MDSNMKDINTYFVCSFSIFLHCVVRLTGYNKFDGWAFSAHCQHQCGYKVSHATVNLDSKYEPTEFHAKTICKCD